MDEKMEFPCEDQQEQFGSKENDETLSKKNYYTVLGVENNATEKQIRSRYRKLALKFHPDRNRGSEEAAEMFKEISKAYAVLSDPGRRQKYDLLGVDDGMEDADLDYSLSVFWGNIRFDMGRLGVGHRVLGAMIERLGIEIPTTVSDETFTKARELCESGILTSNNQSQELFEEWCVVGNTSELDVQLMKFGEDYPDILGRQQSAFFQLYVSEEMVERGFFLQCVSINKSRLKLIVFDDSGAPRFQENSQIINEHYSGAYMYFTPFRTTSLRATTVLFGNTLDSFAPNQRKIEAGNHLICVYGDNWLKRAKFVITAVPADSDDAIINQILSVDTSLQKYKEAEAVFERQYEEAKRSLEFHRVAIRSLIENRDKIYENFKESSIEKAHEKNSAQMHSDNQRHTTQDSAGGKLLL